jgi:heme/copper-type cytochrome/quinol oxidase subunit 4
MAARPPATAGEFLGSRTGLVLIIFLGIAAFFLVTEHTAHLYGVLPFALLLLCPLMHLFMHGGHGGHGGQAGHDDRARDQAERSEGGPR